MYPWPLNESDPALDKALRVTMDYLELSGQAPEYIRLQSSVAAVILKEWRNGVRHPIRLANTAIVIVEEQLIKKELKAFSKASWFG